MNGKFFKFYECCKIVIGAKRSAIYDLQRGNFYFLPNTIIEILKDYENKKISCLFNDYSSQGTQLTKYFNFLLSNELIFYTDSPENFPVMNSVFEKPHFLDFLVMEIDDLQKFKIKFLNESIDTSGVEHLVLINSSNSIENLNIILQILYDSRIKFITFISSFYPGSIKKIKIIQSKNERLKHILFYNTPDHFESKSEKNIEYKPYDLKKLLSRRIDNINNFILNEHSYLESKNHNLYFNRRVFINNNGDVKPSYFHEKKYGNIKTENLKDIISQPDFQILWNTSKDHIEVCKDCEFRYMCPDNRIPIKKGKVYSHRTRCNYDPYKNSWHKTLT